MILVTVGTQNIPFNRLIEYIYILDKEKVLNSEKIIVQYGLSDISMLKKQGLNNTYELYDYMKLEDMEKYSKEAKYIITHAGVGSIMEGLSNLKPTIVIPRLKKFSEHVNDHQLEIANQFANEKKILLANNIDELKNCILVANKDSTTNEIIKSNNENFNNKLIEMILKK